MRWKLLFITSLIAAVTGLGSWSAFAIAFFGSASALARHDGIMFASSILPLTLSAIAAVFVYRHTATRRKTQAVITVLIVLVLSGGIYLAASRLFPNRLTIPAHL
jgi:hypothetical protein